MKLKKATIYFCVLALAIILGYDAWVFSRGGTESTISYVIYEWSYDYPFGAFLAGFVCGHLFWQMKKPKEK